MDTSLNPVVMLGYSDYGRTVVAKIDQENFLNLGKSMSSFENEDTSERYDLFAYAMALGLDDPVEPKQHTSFIRGEYISRRPDAIAQMAAVSVGAFGGQKDDSFLKMVNAEAYAEKCAERGYHILDSMMAHIQESSYLDSLFGDLDELYEKYIGPLE